MNTYVSRLSIHGYRTLLRLAAGMGWFIGMALSALLIYQFDTEYYAITDYRVSSAKLDNDILTISGRLTMARNCEMNYVTFYGDNDSDRVSVNLAQYNREQAMTFTRTIDHGAGPTNFGPIVVPVPGAHNFDWLVIVSSHKCHPFWPHVTTLTKLHVKSIEVMR